MNVPFPGGGAIEMALSSYLREFARSIKGKEQLLIAAYAKALEVIPRQLCDNAGFDATNILNKLRQKHATGMFFRCLMHCICTMIIYYITYLPDNTSHNFEKMCVGLLLIYE